MELSQTTIGTCPICLDEISCQNSNYAKTRCGHEFCFDCITQTMSNSKNCPVCRQELSQQKKIFTSIERERFLEMITARAELELSTMSINSIVQLLTGDVLLCIEEKRGLTSLQESEHNAVEEIRELVLSEVKKSLCNLLHKIHDEIDINE